MIVWLYRVMYEVHSSPSSILHTQKRQLELFKHMAANSHFSIPLNMTNGQLLLLNPILYMPYYNALLFASVEGFDHKKPVAWKINLPLDIQWSVFHWGGSPFIFISRFYLGTVFELSFTAFLSAAFVPNVLARLTSLSPVCGKRIYVLFRCSLFHFAVIHHSTATKAENKAPIMLGAICNLWARWHLVVKMKDCCLLWDPADTKGGPAETLSQPYPAIIGYFKLGLGTLRGTTSYVSKDTCNRHLRHFQAVILLILGLMWGCVCVCRYLCHCVGLFCVFF